MILSNVSLQTALQDGRLVIVPVPMPLRPDDSQPVPCPYQTSSVDLRLGNEISFFRKGLAASVDLRLGKFSDLFAPNSETFTISRHQPFTLEPGNLVLGKTLERVVLPIFDDGRPCLAARIEGKSSYARCGLLVHFTAPTIHAGFEGHITWELLNLGPLRVLLYPEAPICQLIVEQVDGVPFRNDSQFQSQKHSSGRRKRK